MKKSLLFIILFLLPVVLQAQTEKLTDNLRYTVSATPDDEDILVWIFFTDKGNQNALLNKPESVVSGKSLTRRAKVFKNTSLITVEDLPVSNNYIDQLSSAGFVLKQKSKWLNGVSGYVKKDKIESIALFNFVKKIDIVEKLKREYEQTFDKPEVNQIYKETDYLLNYGSSLTQNQQINVPALHNLGFYGQGVTICVMDPGFNNLSHEAFSQMNIIAKWDFVNNDPGVGDSSDMGSGSHGTQTLSTIGGYKDGQLIGPAFQSNYILAKTENTESETPIEEDNWIAALEWADSIGVDVTSTSLGYIDFDPPYSSYTWQTMDGNTARITIAADLAVKKGIVVVNSAGNEYDNSTHNTLGAPADGDSVIAVGAVTSSGVRSSFSSVGPTVDGRIKPDVMAMGSSVRVASPYGTTSYTYSSGTSFSCPLAAGAAALVLCYNPNLTPIQVREALRMTGSRHTNPDKYYGWGIINTLEAANYFPVPVELIAFTAKREGNSVMLRWTTATETNNSGFDIERKSSGSSWSKIGFVKGNGTTSEKINYSFTDKNPLSGSSVYRLKQIDFDGTFEYSKEVFVGKAVVVNEFALQQNYPNPFNPSTRIKYSVADESFVQLKVFNVIGREVAVLVNEIKAPGEYSVEFDGSRLSGGIYFYTLTAGDFKATKKLVLMK